ncbi:cupin domain-containing protein [Clostridium swellfunianum]|uniref:cupin domain-containing protein n=1 Tax=Clostridium swellfunianum TaxID=1367462 RepID=UPI00202EE82B|nr:cupin domain-containing protein [Clostridium swellfunianum]MCM0646897.1 cupin domain-containing protein [Clostridium swellfunianum]
MCNNYRTYPCPYCGNTPAYSSDMMYSAYNNCQCPCFSCMPAYDSEFYRQNNEPYIPFDDVTGYDYRFDGSEDLEDNNPIQLKDYGPKPFVVDINKATKQNDAFRTALWTGKHLQVTLMSIPVGEDIGLEIHSNLDQFLRVEEGQGIVKMGSRKDKLDFQANVQDDFAILIPANTWHNIINTGDIPLKLYSIYAPPQHPFGTVHETKADAEAAEKNHH